MVEPTPLASAPWLVIAVGNPSRGDDALGPALVERLRRLLSVTSERRETPPANGGGEHAACSMPSGRHDDVELLVDFQLQIEHALDLVDRRGVLFVDAALPGVVEGAALVPLRPDEAVPPASHALRPGAVLNVATRINGSAPPAWQLAIEGSAFALGEGLSASARRHLERAVPMAERWVRERRAETDPVGAWRRVPDRAPPTTGVEPAAPGRGRGGSRCTS